MKANDFKMEPMTLINAAKMIESCVNFSGAEAKWSEKSFAYLPHCEICSNR